MPSAQYAIGGCETLLQKNNALAATQKSLTAKPIYQIGLKHISLTRHSQAKDYLTHLVVQQREAGSKIAEISGKKN